MSDFKNKQIKNLIRTLCKAAESGRCKFQFYVNSEIKSWPSKENHNVEKVSMLLEELNRDFGLTCEIKGTQKMSSKEVKRAYASSVYWIRNPKKPYGISRRIYKIFAGGEAGDLFGKEKPALITYDYSGSVLFILPHVVEGFSDFSLRAHILKQNQSYREDTILTIYDFLSALKTALGKKR